MADEVGSVNSSEGAAYNLGVNGLLYRTIGEGEGNAAVSASILDWFVALKCLMPEDL